MMTNPQDDPLHQRLNEMFAAHYTDLLAYAHLCVKDEARAKDIVQTIFIELFENPRLCPPPKDELPYLCGAIKRRSFTDHATTARRKEIYQQYGDQYQPEAERNPEQLLLTTEVLARVRQLLQELPPQRRAVAQLSLAGYKSKEIAEKLGIAEQTVRNTRKEALHFLAVRAIELGIFQSIVLLLVRLHELA